MFATILVSIGFKIGSYAITAGVAGILGFAFRGKIKTLLEEVSGYFKGLYAKIASHFKKA